MRHVCYGLNVREAFRHLSGHDLRVGHVRRMMNHETFVKGRVKGWDSEESLVVERVKLSVTALAGFSRT